MKEEDEAKIWEKCPKPHSITLLNPRKMNRHSISALHVLR